MICIKKLSAYIAGSFLIFLDYMISHIKYTLHISDKCDIIYIKVTGKC